METVEILDGNIVKLSQDLNDVTDHVKVQITRIKNSDVNNGTTFYRLKTDIEEGFQQMEEASETTS